MEDKKTIKIGLETAICIFIIIILLIALVLMYFYYNRRSQNVENTNSNIAEKVENNIDNETSKIQAKKINKLDESKDIVYSSYSKYSSEYSYSIPYINIDSVDAKKINTEIESYYKPLVEEELKNESEGLSINMGNIKYNSYINDNILSVIVSNAYIYDCTYYKVYNLDIYNGTVVNNTDIISLKNMTESKFLDKLKELYQNKFISEYGSKEKRISSMRNAPAGWTESELQEQSKLYDKQLNKTISANNCSIKTPMFLNENGKICVIATIYSLAGANSYEHIIDTNI